MTIRVQSEYLTRYGMPNLCVACCSADTSGKLNVGQSNWNGKQTLSLEFPLCTECNDLLKITTKRARWLGVIAFFGAILGCMLTSNLIVDASGHSNGWAAIIVAVTLFFIIVMGLRGPFTTRGMTQEQRKRVNLINNAVRILDFKIPEIFGNQGHVTFQFKDAGFAAEFASLNNGKLK